MMPVVRVPLEDDAAALRLALERLDLGPELAARPRILLKPNLVNSSRYPVTTRAAFCGALVDVLRELGDPEIVIAEGCGDQHLETDAVFAALGYTALARAKGVRLLDLNHAPLRTLQDPGRTVFKEMHLPEVLFTHYVISLPVLKAHSLAGITGALKNMLGAAPPQYYAGRHGTWKKAVFHQRMQESVADLCAYRSPDLSLMDAGVGLREYHLGGARLDPPAGLLLAGRDPWAVDRAAAELLGLDWRGIGHLHKPN